MKFCFWILVVLIFASPMSLLAESPDGDFEVTVFSGWSFVNVDRDDALCTFCIPVFDPPLVDFPSFFIRSRNEVGDSLLFGTKFGYYLNSRAEIEGTFAIAPNHDVRIEQTVVCLPGEICPLQTELLLPDFFFNENLIAYHYDVNFAYNLTQGNTRPYLTFGVGGISSDIGSNTQDNLKTDLTFNFGGGMKFYFEKLAFRLEVNDHVIPDYFFSEKTEHNIQLQYGILFRLR